MNIEQKIDKLAAALSTMIQLGTLTIDEAERVVLRERREYERRWELEAQERVNAVADAV